MSKCRENASSYPSDISGEMTPEKAKQLLDRGGIFILLDFPEGSQFGLDYSSWETGPKFKGVKMIPPGLHFIYYSVVSKQGGVAPRIGFFHDFHEGEVVLKKWDALNEDIMDTETDEAELRRCRDNIKELDQYLGPYPFETYRKWFSLSNFLSSALVSRLQPLHGRISSQSDLISLETELGETTRVDKTSQERQRYFDRDGLPVMMERPGTELRFTQINRQRSGLNAPLVRSGMDASYSLETMLKAHGDSEYDLLGEIQFAFVCFLIGQLYEAFEHWKHLVYLLCFSSGAMLQRPKLYEAFIGVLFQQLKECPKDFFVDIVSKDNFLTHVLSNFFGELDSLETANSSLKEKAHRFKLYLTKTFKWDFDTEQDEYKPVVVQL